MHRRIMLWVEAETHRKITGVRQAIACDPDREPETITIYISGDNIIAEYNEVAESIILFL